MSRYCSLFSLTSFTRTGYGQNAEDLTEGQSNPFREASGKVLVLVFLRTDCPISNRDRTDSPGVGCALFREGCFRLVYPDRKTLAADIKKYLQDYKYTFPALRDPQRTLVGQSHVQVTPEVAVFDARSRLVYHGRIDNWYEDFSRARPAPTTHELDDAIRAALSGKPPATGVTDAVGCYISDLQ